MAELLAGAAALAGGIQLPSLKVQQRNNDCCGPTCVCCSKGSVVLVEKSFVYQEQSCFEGLFDCLGWNTKKNQETRETVEAVVQKRFSLYMPSDDSNAAKKNAIELLERVDPNWELNKALGKSLPARAHALIIERLREATSEHARAATKTIREKPPQRTDIVANFSALFSQPAPRASSNVAQLLPALISMIDALQDRGVNGIDQVTQVQQWLGAQGYPFGPDAIADLIEVLEGQPTHGPEFDQLVPDVENRFTVAAMASTRA